MPRIVLVIAVFALAGCASNVDLDTAFQNALAQAREGHWDTAMTDTKAILLDYPTAGAAHFLLGQCYLYGDKVNLVQSQGELRTAWEIFRRDKTYAPWEKEFTPEQYEMKLHTVMAAMHMRWISEALALGAPFPLIRQRIEDELKPHIWKGLKLDPDNPFMKNLDATVKEMLKEADDGQRPKPPLTPQLQT